MNENHPATQGSQNNKITVNPTTVDNHTRLHVGTVFKHDGLKFQVLATQVHLIVREPEQVSNVLIRLKRITFVPDAILKAV